MHKEARQEQLFDLFETILRDHPAGITEYDFLQLLRQEGLPVFSDGAFADTLVLFRAHFMLFHLLYCLRDRLFAEKKGDIAIHCLGIRLMAWQEPDTLPAKPDSLRRYYLDLKNMEEVDQVDVDAMIADFWREYAGFDQRSSRLAILDLDETATFDEIKKQFRQLALQHHPDQGGDPAIFQQVSEAARFLLGAIPKKGNGG